MPWRKISSRSRVARRAALEVQLALELLVAVQVLQRVGRADFEGDERVALAGLAELAEAHAVGTGRRELHVLDDLVPARQLVVGADLEPDKLFRRLQARRRGRLTPKVGASARKQRAGEQRRRGDVS